MKYLTGQTVSCAESVARTIRKCRMKINRLAESAESRYLYAAFESTAPPVAFY